MPDANANTTGWGLIAGNGCFPFLVLEGARSLGIDMTVIALKEEAAPELERLAKRLHWVSLGELSKAIDLMHQEGVTQAVMAGQVKHNKIFSAIRPDWKLAKLLLALPRKNTDALIGAVVHVLEDEGIRLVDSTLFLKPLVPEHGILTRRAPDTREAGDIAYGLGVARQISAMDIGQTAGGGESQQARARHAFRCTRDWSAHHRTDEDRKRHGFGGGRRANLAV